MGVRALGDLVDLASISALVQPCGVEFEDGGDAAFGQRAGSVKDMPLVPLNIDPKHSHGCGLNGPRLDKPVEADHHHLSHVDRELFGLPACLSPSAAAFNVRNPLSIECD